MSDISLAIPADIQEHSHGLDTASVFGNISDIHLCEERPGDSMVFPGPCKISPDLWGELEVLITRCRSFDKEDFMVTMNGEFYRGRHEKRAVDGGWYRLRRMPPDPPTLDKLPSKIPVHLKRLLLSPRLSQGGLVYIVGAPAQGKTTTASATLISRLTQYGGFALTVEDPPEMPLNGWHNEGYCSQTWVAGDTAANWAESFRGVLRSQPAGTLSILYVGEVRDTESAKAMLRAAANGFLVVSTGFGTDIISGLEALYHLAGAQSTWLSSLSGLLRLVVHQRVVNEQVVVSSLASLNGTTSVAAKIRTGNFNNLLTDIQFQSNQAMLGIDVFEDQAV
ncbi:ATPase, T2SS/T4P/T4SS family [soil metagenome]